MSGKGKPFLPREYRPWTFAEAHPSIQKLEMHVVHFQGGGHRFAQERIEKDYSETNMPHTLFCSAGCENGGMDLSSYLSSVESQRETEASTCINCRGTFGRSPKGRNPGQQCSHSQYSIQTKITYKP